MKKAKFYLSAIVIMLVSALATACSCMGGGGDINHILAQDINISIVKKSETVSYTIDELSGNIALSCHVGDTFVVQYDITPSNATTTQVDWSFNNGEQAKIVECTSGESTRNKSTSEQVQFKAMRRSETNFKTRLSFVVHDIGKTVHVDISVSPAVEDLSILVAPENVRFDSASNSLKWDPVGYVYTDNIKVPATLSNGIAEGLIRYEVISLAPTTGAQVGEAIALAPNVTTLENLSDGVEYVYQVRAVGDPYLVKSSDYSDPYRFYKIKATENVTNDNGDISFKTTPYANKVVISYSKDRSIEKTVTASTEYSFNYRTNFDSLIEKYEVVFTAFPKDYDSALGYALAPSSNPDSPIKIFPSSPTETLTIQKFRQPTIALVDGKINKSVGGATFYEVHADTALALGILNFTGGDKYDSVFGQGYEWKMEDLANTTNNTIFSKTGTVFGNKLELNDLGLQDGHAYKVTAKTIGNVYNTIYSGETTFEFRLLNHMTSETVTMNGDLLTSHSGSRSGGVELFFVSTTDPTVTHYKEMINTEGANNSYNISAIKLPVGRYNVYAKNICIVGQDGISDRCAVITPASFTKVLTIEVAQNVTNHMIDADGKIWFNPIAGFDGYKLIINNKLKTDVEWVNPYTISVYSPESSADVKYVTETNGDYTAYIDVVEAVKAVYDQDKSGIEFEQYFASVRELTYEIVTIGNGQPENQANEPYSISSPATSAVYFNKQDSISSLELSDYNLKFSKVGTSRDQAYVVTLQLTEWDSANEVEINRGVYVSKEFTGKISGDMVTIDLNSLYVEGSSSETIASKPSQSAEVKNTISVHAVGVEGGIGVRALLNSDAVSKTFDITNTPYSLQVDGDGKLTWRTQTSLADILDESKNYSYTIEFYLVSADGESQTLLTDETLKNIKPSYEMDNISGDDSEDGEGEESGESEVTSTSSTFYLYVNIADILGRYEDQVVAIYIRENKSDFFSAEESSPLHATRITSPVLSTGVADGKDVVMWNAINNADLYDISVTKGGDDAFTYTVDGQSDTKLSITDRLDWTAGVYTVVVSARNSTVAGVGSAYDKPVVLTSKASSLDIYLVDASIAVNVNGDTLSWADITPLQIKDAKVEYGLYYMLSSGVESEYTPEGEGATTTNIIPLGNNTAFDASTFTAGNNTVKVTPSIDWTSTAVRLIGSVKTNSIYKLAQATDLTSNAGNLQFEVHGVTSRDISLDLYKVPVVWNESDSKYEEDTSATANIIGTSNYTYSVEAEEITAGEGENTSIVGYNIICTVVLDGMDAGVLGLKVRVKANNMLTSNASDIYVGTKISTVEDLNKVGEWLTWSAQPGISSYQINYVNGEVVNSITLRVDEQADGSYIPYVTRVDGEDEIEETNASIFKYVDGVFYYAFDHDLFVGDGTGDILFTIRPLTIKPGYFSGNTSNPTTITKLNANVTISLENGVVNIADYEADGSSMPVMYEIKIYMLTTKEIEIPAEEDGGEPTYETQVVRATDPTSGSEIMWTSGVTSYTINDSGVNITPIDLNLISYTDSTSGVIYPFSPAGDYEVELMFIGNGNEIINSALITKEDIDKLASTTMFTSAGDVTWTEVDGADNYTVMVVAPDKTTYEFVIEGNTLKDQVLMYNDGTPDPEPEGGEGEGEGEDTGVSAMVEFKFTPGEKYTLKVKANGADKLHSNWSAPFTAIKLKAPTSVAVEASNRQVTIKVEETTEGEDGPVTSIVDRVLNVGDPLVQWTDVNGIAQRLEYEIRYSEDVSYIIPYSGQYLYAVDTSLAAGSYTVQLRAFGNDTKGTNNIGYMTSDYTDIDSSIILNYVNEVAGLRVSNGVVSWGKVNAAYSYKVVASDDEGNEVFTTYTTSEKLDLSSTNLAELDKYNGVFSFEVTANTIPAEAIVTTSSEVEKENVISIFKPRALTSFDVRNGMLSWRIAYTEIEELVEGSMETISGHLGVEGIADSGIITLALVEYVERCINNPAFEERVADLDSAIEHLLSVNLEINGVTSVVTPTEVTSITVTGEGGLPEQYLEYYYEVANAPEIDESLPEEDESGEEGEESGAAVASTETTSYEAGKYVVRVSSPGNSSSDIPVVRSGYSSYITAYKPNTPKTWATAGADISYGDVQWELSTTHDSTINEFIYYNHYRITALPIGGEGIKYTDISVTDTLNTPLTGSAPDTIDSTTGANKNLIEGYRYHRELKDDLFTDDTSDASATNILVNNTNYRLLISTRGTVDGTLLNDPLAPRYLNSNACVVGNVANILSTSLNAKVEKSVLGWTAAPGSTATKLFIYGPFDNLADGGSKVNISWKDTNATAAILENIDKAHKDNTTSSEYYGKLRTIILADNDGERQTNYTLTDTILNDATFAPGGYIIKTQELGDNKGIVDSVISNGMEVIKLGYVQATTSTTMRAGSWVGTDTDGVFVWNSDSDTWSKRSYAQGTPNQVIGTFVWNPVTGANAYRVELFRINIAGGEGESLEWCYVNDTQYDMPSVIAYNDPQFKYYIKVSAVRVDNRENHQLSDNYFSSDSCQSSAHERLAIPDELKIYGSGKITWDGDTQYTTIGSYRVRFNYGEEDKTHVIAPNGNVSVVPELDMGVGSQNGTIEIAVKAVAISGNEWLNSSYCTAVSVTRLADPDVRLIDGVFHWGSTGDPITPSELTLDDEMTIISAGEGESTYNTYYKYFTDITAHDSTYTSTKDENLYKQNGHKYEVRFQGTGGEDGYTMVGGLGQEKGEEPFYISSNLKTLEAYKLAAPSIENVYLDVAGNSKNMVKWELDSYAQGYRVRVFSNISEDYVEDNIDIVTLQSASNTSNFTLDDENGLVYFCLDGIIEEMGLIANGGNIYIYVQALGSGACATKVEDDGSITVNEDMVGRPTFSGTTQTNELYLSSSYSTPTTIGVPPAPVNIAYDEDTGILSWEVGEKQEDGSIKEIGTYNIKIETHYTVDNVSQDELNNYWIPSSNMYAPLNGTTADNNKTITPYGNIVSRSTSVVSQDSDGEYTLNVVDIILLKASENLVETDDGYVQKTPSKYTITSIGANYQFFVTAMSFVSSGEETFASKSVQLGSSADRFAFQKFQGGDGSEYNPYRITSVAELQTISSFLDRDFELMSDIVMKDGQSKTIVWTPVLGEFTGTLDGNNKTISNLTFESVVATDNDKVIMSMFENNSGTIKDINLNLIESGISYNTDSIGIVMTGVAITSYGTIDNVHVVGNMTAKPTGNAVSTTIVTGITAFNYGTVNNSSFNGVLVSLNNTSNMSLAGGLVGRNYATISRSRVIGKDDYTSSIEANTVAGIAVYNNGIIDRCYVDEFTTISVTNNSLDGKSFKGALAGGLVGGMQYNVLGLNTITLTNSYSRAKIIINQGGDASDATYTVGGLVGNLKDQNNAQAVVSIRNCYVATNIVKGTIANNVTQTVIDNQMYQTIDETGVEEEDKRYTNNYYIVVSAITQDSCGGEKVDTLDALNNALSSLTDNSVLIYVTDSTGNNYPTLNI